MEVTQTPTYPHPACFLWMEKTASTQHRECPGDKETCCPTSSMEFSFPFPAQGGCILSFLASLWRNFQLKQPLLGLKCAPTEASCLRCSAIPTAIAVVSTKRALGRASGVPPDFLSPSPCPGPSHYKAPQVSNGMLAMGVHCRCLCVRDLAAPLGLGVGELERRGSRCAQRDPSGTGDWSQLRELLPPSSHCLSNFTFLLGSVHNQSVQSVLSGSEDTCQCGAAALFS